MKNKTLESHVSEFGDIEMAYKYDTSDFQGQNRRQVDSQTERTLRELAKRNLPRDAIRSDEVEFHLTRIHSELNDDDSFERLVRGRRLLNQFMKSLRAKLATRLSVDPQLLSGKNKVENRDCYEELIHHFTKNCIPLHLHTYLFRHLYVFVNACNTVKRANPLITSDDLKTIISQHCSPARGSFVSMAKVV